MGLNTIKDYLYIGCFGRRFPIGLKDEDYETIYTRLERECLVEPLQGKLKLTEKGKSELKMLAEKPVGANFGTQQKFLSARKIYWYAEGL